MRPPGSHGQVGTGPPGLLAPPVVEEFVAGLYLDLAAWTDLVHKARWQRGLVREARKVERNAPGSAARFNGGREVDAGRLGE
jgi:hypothetical protein